MRCVSLVRINREKNMKRVTKKESALARQFGDKLIKKLRDGLKDHYKFDVRLVGSARWNIILKEEGKMWDVDYQILLSNNSKEYKENSFSKPTKIKEDFFNYFNNYFNSRNGFRVENSTTAITILNKNNGYSFDFVIIKDKNQIIRRNNSDATGRNSFTWNKLKKYNEAYNKFNSLSPTNKNDLIENYILPRKKKEKAKHDNDPTKRSSCELFIEEVNNYVSAR